MDLLRLVTAFVSGKSDADVVTVDQMWNGQYKDNGWIMALDDFIAADADTDIQDFIPEVLYSLNTWRGNIVTLPIAAYGQGTLYRTDVFDEMGLDAPPTDEADAEGWTWAKYMEIAGAINGTTFGDTDMFGTVMVGAQPVPVVHMYSQLAASRGVRWFQSFPEAPWDFTPTINSPENVEALNAYKSLYEMSPAEAINYVWFDAGTRYSQGDIGMFFWWTPYFYLVWNNGYMSGELSTVKETTGVGLLPQWDDVPNVTSLGGWSLGIPSTTTHADDAWKYVKWATSAETQKKMGQVPDYNFQFSDFASVSNYEDAELQEIYPYLDTQLKIMRQGNGKVVRPPMPTYSTLEGIYGLQLNRALDGSLSAEDALAETDLTWQNILKGNFMIPYQLESFDDTLESTQALIDQLAG
ncbi:extracellular solute-binding protein [Chloroflexi bacterium TSY]|nr:extracellular solute-binding protein [Chloroflexi bacterium TSY]